MDKIGIISVLEDENLNDKLLNDLDKHGFSWTYKIIIKNPDEYIEKISDAIGESDHLLHIISRNCNNYMEKIISISGTEEQNPFLLDYENLLKNNNEIKRIDFNNYEDGLNNLLGILKRNQPLIDYGKIQFPTEINPFGKIRTEYFDEHLLADTFYEPEKEKYDLLKGSPAVILEGGRGSGKTMLLRSLDVIPSVHRTKKKDFFETKLSYFGVYLKLDRGGFILSSEKELENFPESLSRILFVDDFNLQFTESVIETLRECIENKILIIDKNLEKEICQRIKKIFIPLDEGRTPENWQQLSDWIAEQKREMRIFLANYLMAEQKKYDGPYSEFNTIKGIWNVITSTIPALSGITLFLLLDEYESLLESQQIITNTLIKKSDNEVTLKVATKFEGLYTRQTLLGQDIQASNDYQSISLDYDLIDEKVLEQYKTLLKEVSKKLLRLNHFEEIDITSLLHGDEELHIKHEDLVKELEKMLQKKGQKLSDYDDDEIKSKITYYRQSLTFRALYTQHKRRKKSYSGFETFVYLSSGIIRQFMELCGMNYYLMDQNNIDVKKIKHIPSDVQTRSVHNVSAGIFEKIAPEIEDFGLTIQLFLMDIGDMYRAKLLNDANEPETNRIGLNDPIDGWPKNFLKLYKVGLRESIFQKRKEIDAMKPKSSAHSRPHEILINRIFCPALEIAYGARWRSNFESKELAQLLNPSTRAEARKKLIARMKKDSQEETSHKLDGWNE